jgi:hypothetical protein
MQGTIKIKYTGTNIGEYETSKTFNFSEDFEIIISTINNKYLLTFDFKVSELNIDTKISYSLHGLNNGDDLVCNKGIFSIFLGEILIIKTTSILIGNLAHIVENEQRVDNFSILILVSYYNY